MPAYGPQPIAEAANEQIAVAVTPAVMWARALGTAPELWDLRPDWPLGPVTEYPELGRVLDIYAYDVVQWQVPRETFDIPGPVHTAFEDAHVASSLPGQVLNLSAPLPAYANVPNYGL